MSRPMLPHDQDFESWARRVRSRALTSVTLAARLLLALSATAAVVHPAAQANPDALSIDTSHCTAPASTPACASRTWDDCLLYRNPALCAEVGHSWISFWEIEENDDDQRIVYRKLPPLTDTDVLDRLKRTRAQIQGVREIPRDRFTYDSDHGTFPGLKGTFELPRDVQGTHEVMYGWDHDGSIVDAHSRFFRKEGGPLGADSLDLAP